MELTENDLLLLASNIIEYLKKDFDVIRLSGNLRNTITLEKDDDGLIIKIPAMKYNIGLWKAKGVIVYTHEGSYATTVNKYNKNHKSFVEKSIQRGINDFLQQKNIQAEVIQNAIRKY